MQRCSYHLAFWATWTLLRTGDQCHVAITCPTHSPHTFATRSTHTPTTHAAHTVTHTATHTLKTTRRHQQKRNDLVQKHYHSIGRDDHQEPDND